MKHLKTLAATFMAIAMVGCSQDQVGPDTPTPPEDGIYSSIKLKMPTTRSGENNEGTENGKDYENNVASILVVLATKEATDNDYKFLAFALNDATVTNNPESTHKIVFQDKKTLFEHAGETVYVFAYCNPSSALVKTVAGTYSDGKYTGGLTVGASFTDLTYTDDPTDQAKIWSKNGFLMTSVSIKEAELGDEEDLKAALSPENAFDLGTVDVIRAASRFDFRDASPCGAKETNPEPYTYEIKDEDKADKPLIAKITLTRIAMVNQRSEFYYLPRTTTITGTPSVTLCPGFFGMESNHVLTPAIAKDANGFSEVLPKKMTSEAIETLDWTTMTELEAKDEDIDNGDPVKEDPNESDGWQNSDNFKTGYHIWRYTTENTWPVLTPNADGYIDMPTNSSTITTGFVFEAEIKPVLPEGVTIGTDPMYCFNNRLFVNAKAIYDAVQAAPVSTLADAFKNAFEVTKTGDNITITPKTDEKVEAEGFTIYKPGNGKYYCYYFGFNRHVDNSKPYATGDMEFATVRNNVYKLAITNIKKFGTLTPPTDVEEWDTFFTLQVRVRPWVVRINNFEF